MATRTDIYIGGPLDGRTTPANPGTICRHPDGSAARSTFGKRHPHYERQTQPDLTVAYIYVDPTAR